MVVVESAALLEVEVGPVPVVGVVLDQSEIRQGFEQSGTDGRLPRTRAAGDADEEGTVVRGHRRDVNGAAGGRCFRISRWDGCGGGASRRGPIPSEPWKRVQPRPTRSGSRSKWLCPPHPRRDPLPPM